MKRQRRKRSTRRRGMQHIGDVLSTILTDIDQIEAQEDMAAKELENNVLPLVTSGVGNTDAQNTFSFYQPVQ